MSIEEELEKIMPLEDWLISYKELTALRAWKAKATPFLEEKHEELKDTIKRREMQNMFLGDMPFYLKELTKLLEE